MPAHADIWVLYLIWTLINKSSTKSVPHAGN